MSAATPQARIVKADSWTVRRYYGEWIERRKAPVVRASTARDYRGDFRNYILEVLGEVELEDLSLAHLEDLRNTMRKQELSEKTIRNVIDGSFRAMMRDAERDDIPAAFPFAKMMDQFARRRKLVPNLVLGERTCSISTCARHRIEQREQDQPGEEAADMGLPGDARSVFHADGSEVLLIKILLLATVLALI